MQLLATGPARLPTANPQKCYLGCRSARPRPPIVIACPFCHTALAETAPPCPRCNLDLTKARGVLDPVLSVSGLTDLSQTLTPADKKTLIKASLAFNERFPQCRTLMIIKDFPPQSPLGVPLFWLFNVAGLSGDDRKHGKNRNILIVGYGLEPDLPHRPFAVPQSPPNPDLRPSAILQANALKNPTSIVNPSCTFVLNISRNSCNASNPLNKPSMSRLSASVPVSSFNSG